MNKANNLYNEECAFRNLGRRSVDRPSFSSTAANSVSGMGMDLL